MTDAHGHANADSSQPDVTLGQRLKRYLRYVAPIVFTEELVRAAATHLAAKSGVILGKLGCIGLLVLGYSGELTSECTSDPFLTALGARISGFTLAGSIFYMVLWAEVFFGVLLLYRTRFDAASRFTTALRVWTLLCVIYYTIAICYGADRFVHSAIKETMYLAMSTVLLELADQVLHFRAGTRWTIYGSAVAIAATTLVPSLGPLLPMVLTSLYGVFAAALAGWAWKERLSVVERAFWAIYVVSLLYRIKAYYADPDELVLYYAFMNAKWVTLSACCSARVTAGVAVVRHFRAGLRGA